MNSQAEYEALIIGLKILKKLGANDLTIFGDFQLIIRQMNSEYKCSSFSLALYFAVPIQFLQDFDNVDLQYFPRGSNWEVNNMPRVACRVCRRN